MTKNSNRKGLALGAIFALVTSVLTTAPAAQAQESGLVIEPIAGTSYTMVNTEDFIVTTRLGAELAAGSASTLKYKVEKSGTVGYGLSLSHTVSATTVAADNVWTTAGAAANTTTVSSLATTSTVSVVAAVSADGTYAKKNQLRIQLWSFSALTSASPAADVKITSFLDLNGDGEPTGTEPSSSVTVKFVALNAMGAGVTLTAPVTADVYATASATLTGINYQQLGGNFKLGFFSTNDGVTAYAANSASADITPATLADGNYSYSEAIAAATASAVSAASISAVLWYQNDSSVTNPDGDDIVASQKLGVAGSYAFDGVTFSATVGDNFKYTGSSKNTGNIRVNSSVALSAWAYTGSAVSTVQATKFWFAVSGLSAAKYVTVNSVKYTDSAKLPTESTAIAVAAGTKGAITLETYGFSGTETITFNQKAVNKTATLTLTVVKPTFVLESDAGLYAVAAPGAESVFNFTVVDDWEVVSNRTNQRLSAVTSGSGFSTSDPVIAAVAAGKGAVKVTTLPATKTGSATVTVTLQSQDPDTGTWVDGDTEAISLTVTSSATIFSAAVTKTVSASVSYTTYSWSGTITGTTNVAGAVVTVESKGLVFEDGSTELTASDKITIRSGASGTFTLKAASKLAGKYTVSYTTGTTTTTSQVIIDAAGSDRASKIVYSATSIPAGSTAVITGTLVDVNGNPVAASISATYAGTGAGIVVGSMPTTTDADGKFIVNMLAGSTDKGTGKLTVVVAKSGIMTDVATYAQDITVGATTAPVVADQKLTVGSFKGYVAIYAKGYAGKKLSAKVAGKWISVASLSDFQRVVRNTGAGYTIKVDLYIDGSLVKSETVTTK